MATFNQLVSVSMTAGSSISLYRFLTFASDGAVDHAGSAQGAVHGVSLQEGSSGDTIAMGLAGHGIAKLEVGSGGLTRGAVVATDASGKAIARGASNGDLGHGIALEAGDAGDIIRVLLLAVGQVNA